MVEAERLLVTVEAVGDDAASRGIREVGRSAIRSSADVSFFGEQLDDTGRDALLLAGNLQGLRLALDETSDEFNEVTRSAGVASGAMNAHAGTTLTAAAAHYTMHDAIIAGAVPALIVLGSTLGPLTATVGALAAGVLSLAGAFGAVLGAGVLAWGDKLASQKQRRLNQVEAEIARLEALRETEDGLTQAQQERLVQLQKEAGQLEAQTTIMGALTARMQELGQELANIIIPWGRQFIPLIESAVAALPTLVQRMLDAAGSMQPFTQELRRLGQSAMTVIPNVIGWMADLARESLPVWRRFTEWAGRRVPDALVWFRSVVEATWQPIKSLTVTFIDTLRVFTEFGVVATQVVVPMLNRILEGFQDLLRWVMDLPPNIRDLVIALGALAPVFTVAFVGGAELVRILGGLATTLTTTGGIVARITPDFRTLAKVFGIVGLAAAALAVGYTKNFADIREATDNVSRAIREEFTATMRTARQVIPPIVSDISQAFFDFEIDVEGALARVVGFVETHLVAGIRAAGRTIRSILLQTGAGWAAHGDRLIATVKSAYGTARDVARGALHELRTAHITVWNALPAPVNRALTRIHTRLVQFRGTLETFFTNPTERARDVWFTVLREMPLPLFKALRDIHDGLVQVKGWLTAFIEEPVTEARNVWFTILREMPLPLFKALRDIHDRLVQFKREVEQHTDDFKRLVLGAYRALPGAIQGVLTRIAGLWNEHKGSVIPSVVSAYEQLRQKIRTAIQGLQEFLAPILGGVKQLWDEHSGAVKQTITDVATAIREDPVGAARSLLESLPGPLSNIAAEFITTFGNIKQNAIPKFERAIQGIGDAIREAAHGNINAALGELSGAFRDTFTGMRLALVGEDGTSGTFGAIIEGMEQTLIDAAGVLAAAAGIAFDELVFAMEETAIALIGGVDGSGEGMVDKLIGSIADFLKSDALDRLLAATGELLGKGVRAVFEEAFNLIMWNDDSLIKSLISSFVTYLKNDALDDVGAAFQILLDNLISLFKGFAKGLLYNSLIKDLFRDIASYIKTDAASDLVSAARSAAEDAANALINKFNDLLPDTISIPQITLGGGSIDLPSAKIAGRTIGGGSLDVPSMSIGGQSWDMPKLAQGGFIEEAGVAFLHPGEQVIPAAEVQRATGGGQKTVNNVHIEIDARDGTHAKEIEYTLSRELDSLTIGQQ